MFLFLFSRTRVYTFFPLLPSPPQGPAPPPQTPQSSIVSVEHCLSFDCFRFPSFDFRFDLFFFGFESPPPVHSHTPHPLFLFNLTPFYIVLFFSSFFYLSLSLCSKRTVPLHRRSLTCAVETYQFSPGSGREEEHHLNILCLFLTGSLSVCVCARRERGGTTRGTVAEGFLNMV